MGMHDWLRCYRYCSHHRETLVLSRICQMIRRGMKDVDDLYTHSYLDTRGLRAYPKTKRKQNQECPYKIERMVEGDCY